MFNDFKDCKTLEERNEKDKEFKKPLPEYKDCKDIIQILNAPKSVDEPFHIGLHVSQLKLDEKIRSMILTEDYLSAKLEEVPTEPFSDLEKVELQVRASLEASQFHSFVKTQKLENISIEEAYSLWKLSKE